MCVCVSGGKKCLFFGNFGVLCFLETPVLRFALLPYSRRIVLTSSNDSRRCQISFKIKWDLLTRGVNLSKNFLYIIYSLSRSSFREISLEANHKKDEHSNHYSQHLDYKQCLLTKIAVWHSSEKNS